MKAILSLFILIWFCFNLQAQDRADYFYDAGYFKEASTLYEKQLSKERTEEQQPLQFKLANAYFQMHNYSKSHQLYKELYTEGYKDSLVLYRLAELNRMSCDYEKAKGYYASLGETDVKMGPTELRDVQAKRIQYPQENDVVIQSVELKPLNLPQVKKGMGYSYFKDGDLIAGIEKKDKETKTTFTTLGVLTSSSEFQDIKTFEFNSTTPFFNAYPSYLELQNELFFTANRIGKKKSFKEGVNVLQVFSLNIESKENEPKLLSFNKEEHNYTHPSISRDGKRLYFVSDQPGGFGGYDIYYVEKTADGWSEMANCGKEVNTAFDELTPYISGDSLFFSSYGHENYGGSDIFVSIKNEDGFTKVDNMGLPVNSCKNDFSFIFDSSERKGLLTSNRESNDPQEDDVFEITFPETVNLVLNRESGEPIPDVAVLINEDNDLITDENGEWLKNLTPGEDVSITFDNPYYETKTMEFEAITQEQIEQIKNVELTPVVIEGKTVDNITSNPLGGVEVTLYEKTKDDEWKRIKVKKSDANGDWEFYVRKDREYKVDFEKNDYLTRNEVVPRKNDDASKSLRNEVMSRMNPMAMKYEAKKDLVIQINNIYFDFNSSYIQENSFPVIEKLKEFLTDNPNVNIELSAHTDCIGKKKYNLWLSDRRAERTRKHLVDSGISPERIVAKGYGEEKMIVSDCELQKRDDSKAQKNRRVEVKIL